MDDNIIIEMYFARNEEAITATDKKYGRLCTGVAMNILSDRRDAQECVNDTYHAAWQQIPPQRPISLSAFLCRIVRNLSISRFRANRAEKRYSGMEIMLSELEDCIPDGSNTEQQADSRQLARVINNWLEQLSDDDRALFVCRYWYGRSVQSLARQCACPANRMAQRMLRLRQSLKAALEEWESTEGSKL